MDFNQVRYFLTLANTLNFTRAAKQCHVTQPALTQAIKRLETELGSELIHREGRRIELTELGKSLRSHFEQIERSRNLVKATAKAAISGEFAELNIGIMCTIGPRVLAGMLNAFQMQHPKVLIILHDIVPECIPDLLLSGVLDGVFCADRGLIHPQLRFISFFKEALVVAFPQDHQFMDRDVVPLQALAGQRYVERLHCEFRKEIQNFHKVRDIELNVVFRSQREDWIQSLIRDGIGIACIPRYSLLSPELDHRLITEPTLSRQVGLAIVQHAEKTPAMNLLIELANNYVWPESNLS